MAKRRSIGSITLREIGRAVSEEFTRSRQLESARRILFAAPETDTEKAVAVARRADLLDTRKALRALERLAWIDAKLLPVSRPIFGTCLILRSHLEDAKRAEAAAARPRGGEERWPRLTVAIDSAIARGESPAMVMREVVRVLVAAGLLKGIRTQVEQQKEARRLLDARKKRGIKARKSR